MISGVRMIEAHETPQLSETLAVAFHDDPALGWCFTDRDRRTSIYPAFFQVILRAYLAQGQVFTAGRFDAGAICLPSGMKVDREQLAMLDGIAGEYAPRLTTIASLTRDSHPRTPHYFVAFIGTRPESQGRGIGSALLYHLLTRNDREGVATYLEATSPLNRRLYAEHGFETIGRVDLPSGPSMWPMWREPGREG